MSAEDGAGERFGARHGLEKAEPQGMRMDERLRNGLWDVLYRHWPYSDMVRTAICTDWAGMTLDELEAQDRGDLRGRAERMEFLEPYEAAGVSPLDADSVLARVKKEYFGLPEDRHYRIYELVELACGGLEGEKREEFTAGINSALARNRSLYKLINCRLECAMSRTERGAVEEASKISPASSERIRKAMYHMSPRSRNYEESIAESIKALEHTAQELGGKGGGLGSMVGSIADRLDLHPATREQLSLMYKFANKAARHLEPDKVYEPDAADAKAVLVWCAAMANYLVEKDAAAKTPDPQARGGEPAVQANAKPPGAEDATAHTARGTTLLTREKYADALGAFDKALEIDPSYADAHHGRGRALFMEGKRDEALEAYARAIAYDANHFMSHLDRGTVLATMSLHKEAAASFGKACMIKPKNAEAHIKKAQSLHEIGRHDEALGSCRRARELDPDNPEVHSTKADVLVSLESHEDALESIDRAISLDRSNAVLHVTRGQILDRLGRTSDALTAYHTAIRMDPAMSRLVPHD